MLKLIVDPNSGYLYGFPKAVPEEFVTRSGDEVFIADGQRKAFSEWLQAECGGNEIGYVRMWIERDI
jgi:hypothetical protein